MSRATRAGEALIGWVRSQRELALLESSAGRAVAAVLGVIALATAIGLVALWPPDRGSTFENNAVVGDTEQAQATAVSLERGCEAFAGPGCRLVELRMLDGPHEGERSYISLPGGDELSPEVVVGDRVRVAPNAPSGIDPALTAQLPVDDPSQQPYAFVDFERRTPLLALALAFGVLVVVLGRRRGALSLVGLAVSLAIVVAFVAPAILQGEQPVLVALVGSMAVMFATVTLAHGVDHKSAAALLGTTGALLLTVALAVAFVQLTQITGYSSEEATLLKAGTFGRVSPQGLVLAGIVIGALGVLDDVTVSQASTVMALRRANPAQGVGQLYRRALEVGRDHIAATVNTLVLAYAGAALPILLIFSNQQTTFAEAVNREPVAAQIVATLVGSIGLIAAVPLTTLLAAVLAVRVPEESLADEAGVAHAH